MTKKVYCAFELDIAFDKWIRDHMYPLDYRKEKAMKKPAHRHIDAITRAQSLLRTGIDVANKPKLAKSIQDDMLVLQEVREMLYQIIENPTLPFVETYDDPIKPLLNPIEDEPNEAD